MKRFVLGTSFVTIATFCVWVLINESASHDSSASAAIHDELTPTGATTTPILNRGITVAATVFDSSIDQEPWSKTSLDGKLERQRATAINASGLSEEDFEATQGLIFDTFYDPNGGSEFLTDLHELMTDQFGAKEADFKFAVINAAGDWEEVKRLVRDRGAALGDPYYHDAFLLDVGINTGNISAEEVEILVGRGGVLLPDRRPPVFSSTRI